MAYKPPSWMRASKTNKPKTDSGPKKSGFRGGTTVGAKQPSRLSGNSSSAPNPLSKFGDKPSKKSSSGGSTKPSYPVSAAAQAKADKAQASAKRYRDVQRAANKAKRAVLSRKGPQDIAGRAQREMDLKRYRDLQKGADSWKDKARGQGLRFGGDKPAGAKASSGSNSSSSRSNSGDRSGGSTAAGRAVASASSGSSAKAGIDKGQIKYGAVISRARAAREKNLGIPISAKELRQFMNVYEATHSGTLSRENAVLLARQIKRKGGAAARRYGLSPVEESGAPNTGIH